MREMTKMVRDRNLQVYWYRIQCHNFSHTLFVQKFTSTLSFKILLYRKYCGYSI